MKSKGVDPNLSTRRAKPEEMNEPQAPEDVAALEDVTASEGDDDPAAAFGERRWEMSFPADPELIANGQSLLDLSAVDEAQKSFAIEVEATAFAANELRQSATEVHEDLGVCVASAEEDLTASAQAASDDRAGDAGSRFASGARKLRDVADFILDVLGPAAHLTPGAREYLTVREGVDDLLTVAEAVRKAPEKSREVADGAAALLGDLDAAATKMRGAFGQVAEGVQAKIDALQPGQSVTITVGGGVEVAAARAGEERSLTVARLKDGSFVIESETKTYGGVGKESGEVGAVNKLELGVKMEWAAKDAKEATKLAATIGLGQMVGEAKLVQGALLARSPENLKSVELSGALASEVAAGFGGETAKVAIGVSGEAGTAVKIGFVNGKPHDWEVTSGGKVKGEVALKLAEKVGASAGQGDRAAGPGGVVAEAQYGVRARGKLAPGADPLALLTGDASSFRAEGEVSRDATVTLDLRKPPNGVKIEGSVPVDDLKALGSKLGDGDVDGAVQAFLNLQTSVKTTSYRKSTSGVGGSVATAGGGGEVVGKVEHGLEGDSHEETGSLEDLARRAWRRVARDGDASLGHQVARGRIFAG